MAKVLEEGLAISEFADSSGTPLLGVYYHDREYPWIYAAEIDRRTIFVPLRVLTFFVILQMGLLMVFATIATIVTNRTIVKPIQQLSNFSSRIADGELTYLDWRRRSRDEIGTLASTFNEAVKSLSRIVSAAQSVSSDTQVIGDSLSNSAIQTSAAVTEKTANIKSIEG